MQLYRDWEARRAGREFPARSDFDPVDLKYILGYLSVIDVLRGPLRFRYRIHASNAADRLGFDLTGKELDALPDERYRKMIREHHETVLEKRTPVVVLRDHHFDDSRTWHCEALGVPLSSDGTVIDMLMSAVVWR